jgi:hypothetical protein
MRFGFIPFAVLLCGGGPVWASVSYFLLLIGHIAWERYVNRG